MDQNNIPKWQKEVLQVLRDRYKGDELEEQIKKAQELVNLSQEVEVPSGDTGQVVAQMLKMASDELRPLTAVYVGYQLGIAYERYQNANRA